MNPKIMHVDEPFTLGSSIPEMLKEAVHRVYGESSFRRHDDAWRSPTRWAFAGTVAHDP